jgi:hypothetical protein
MHRLFSIQFQSLQSIQNKDAFLKKKKLNGPILPAQAAAGRVGLAQRRPSRVGSRPNRYAPVRSESDDAEAARTPVT